MKPRIDTLIVPCVLICVVSQAFALVPSAPVAESRVFQALAENDLDLALDLIRSLPKTSAYALAREGAAVAVWMNLRWDLAAQCWLDSARDAERRENLPAYLALLERARDEVPLDEPLEDLLGELLERRDLSPLHRREVLSSLYRLSVDRGDWEKAMSLLPQLGQISRWWYVVGTFSRFGTMDFREPFPPERDLSRETYPGFYRTVFWRPAVASPLGLLALRHQVDPEEGWAYAITAIRSPSGGEAILELQTGDDVVAWWNGMPVLSAQRTGLSVEDTHRRSIEVRPELNWLLVKLRAQDGFTVVARIYRPDGSPLAFDAVEPSFAAMAEMKIVPGDPPAWQSVREQPAAVYPQLHQWLDLIYDSQRAHKDRDFVQERTLLSAAQAAMPASIVPMVLLAESYDSEAQIKDYSRERLKRRAVEMYTRAQGLSPAALWPALRLAEDHQQRGQSVAALSVLEKALGGSVLRALAEEKPSLSTGLLLGLAQICDGLDYSVEQVTALRLALRRNPESIRAVRDQARALRARNANTDAADVWRSGLQIRAANPYDLANAARLLADAGWAEEAEQRLRARLEMDPAALELHEALAAVIARGGRTDEALRVRVRATEQLPDSPNAHRALAIAALAAGDSVRAASAARTCLALRPGDATMERLLAAAGGGSAEFAAPYDITVEQVDRSRVEAWRKTRASVVYLIDILVERIQRTHAVARYTHQALLLLDRAGVEANGELSLPGHAEILYVRTRLPDGTVHVAEQIQRDGGSQIVSLYGLEVGAIVEYAYLEYGPGQPNGGSGFETVVFHFGALSEPMALSRLVVLAPVDMPLLWQTNPPDFTPRQETRGTQRVLWWERRNVDGIKPEQRSPDLAEITHSVRLTTLVDWSTEGPRMDAYLFGRREESSAFRKALAEIEGAQTSDPLGRARSIYRYVQDLIDDRTVGRTDLDALDNRAGAPHTKQALLARLLEEAQVRCRPAFIYRLDYDSLIRPLPSPHLTRRAVVFVGGPLNAESPPPFGVALEHDSGLQNGFWLDPADRYLGFGELPTGQQNDLALVITSRGQMWEPVNPAAWPGNWTRQHAEVALEAGGDAVVRARVGYEGNLRQDLRRRLTDPQLGRRLIDAQVVATGMKGIVASRAEIYGQHEKDGPLFLDLEGRWPSALQRKGGSWQLLPIVLPLNLSSYVQDASREFPLDLRGAARIDLFCYSFVLPDRSNLRWGFLPDDVLVVDPRITYALTFRREGRSLTVCRSAVLRPGLVKVDEYAAFTATCRQIDTAERVALDVVPIP